MGMEINSPIGRRFRHTFDFYKTYICMADNHDGTGYFRRFDDGLNSNSQTFVSIPREECLSWTEVKEIA